jgi:hypothetical protein
MLAQWLHSLWILNLLGALALALNLARNGLYRTYQFLFAYLLADVAQDVALMVLPSHSNAYGYTYAFTQPIKTVLAVLVVLELYQVALAQRPALARFGRNTVGCLLAGAAAAALCFSFVDASIPTGGSLILHVLNTVERTMDLGMMVFLVVISLFIAWFPVRVTRNGALYIGGLLVYFLARATGLLLTNLVPPWRERCDLAMLSVSLACLVVWVFALREAGELASVTTSHHGDADRAARLTGQLDAINQRLMVLSSRSTR